MRLPHKGKLLRGDYYFFVAKDLTYGILGHSWQRIMVVFGERLKGLFDGVENLLDLTDA